MKKVLVIGSNGQLGRCLADRYNTYQTHFISTSDREIDLDYKFVDIETVDITKAESIDDLFSDYRPDYVVNCAAYTNVPKAETDQMTAYHVNEIGPGNLAKACKSYDAKLIHISTDYVYNVNGLIDETTSLTKPLNIYGISKLLGDLSVLDENEENSRSDSGFRRFGCTGRFRRVRRSVRRHYGDGTHDAGGGVSVRDGAGRTDDRHDHVAVLLGLPLRGQGRDRLCADGAERHGLLRIQRAAGAAVFGRCAQDADDERR